MSDSLRSSIIDIGWRINTRELERANAETDAMINKADKASSSFSKTSKSVDNTTSALDKSAKNIDKNSGKIVDFGKKSKKNLDGTSQSAKDTAKKVDGIGKEFDQSANSAKKFGTNGSKHVKNVGDSAKKSTDKIERLSDVSERASNKIDTGFNKAKVAVMAFTAVTVAGAKTALSASSDYEESLNKVDAVFDKDAASVRRWSDQTIKGIGLASATALDLSSGYGDMATSMGINTEEASEMSMTMVDLAADLASFKNKDISQINTALNGVFTGEGEALKGLGVVMTQAQLDQYALSKGYEKSIKEMKQDELVRLRYNYLLEKTSNAQGDFANNLDSVANSERVFQETTKGTAKVFGDLLAPAYVKILNYGTGLLEKTSLLPDKFDELKFRFKPFYDDTVEYLGGAKDYIVDELLPSAKQLAENMGPGFLDGAKSAFKSFGWIIDNGVRRPLEWLNEYADNHPKNMKTIAKWAGFGIAGILGFSIVGKPIFSITKKVKDLKKSIKDVGDSAIVSAGKAKLGFETMDKSVPVDSPLDDVVSGKSGKLSKAKSVGSWLVKGSNSASRGSMSLARQSLAMESGLIQKTGIAAMSGKLTSALAPITAFGSTIGGLKGFAKSIPGISYLSAGANLIGMNKDNAAEKIGGSAGQLGGGGIGALIGTFIAPGVGTAIGGAVGTFVGDKLGENLSKSIKDNWPAIKDGAISLWDSAKENIITGPFVESVEGIFNSAKTLTEKAVEKSKNELDEDVISAKDGKVNKQTAKSVNKYVEEDNKVSAKLDYVKTSGVAYTEEDSKEVIESYDKMQKIVQDHIDRSRKNSQSDFDKLVESGVMSSELASNAANRSEENWKFREDKQKEYHDNLVKLEEERSSKIKDSNKLHEDEVKAIRQKAADENRELTSSENDKIIMLDKQRQEEQAKIMDEYNAKQKDIQEQSKNNAVMTLSASAQEQMIILGRLSDSSDQISAKQAQGMIKNSYSAKEETIKNAEEQFNETKSILENKLYVTGEITKAEYDEALANAKKMKEDTVTQATEQHQKVVDQATQRSDELIKLANLETGESLNIWEKFKTGFVGIMSSATDTALSTWNVFKSGLQGAVNFVIQGINKPLAFFGVKKIPEWGGSGGSSGATSSNDSYGGGMKMSYKGDRSSYAGPALVGEEGVELAYNKSTSSARLLGSNGPEVANIGSNERILSHKETVNVLNGGLGAGSILPGFDKGKGGKVSDIISSAKEIGTDLWDSAKEIGSETMDWLTDPAGKVKELVAKYNKYTKEPTVSGFGWGSMTSVGNGAVDWVKSKTSEILASFSGGEGGSFGNGAFAPHFGGNFTMTSDFGNRAALFGRSFHNGMDFAAPMGTPLVAQHPGVVSHAGYVNSYGNLVAVNVAKGMHTLYGHMQSIAVRAGQAVGRGGLLGTVGSTGDSTGPHVHYELKKGGVFGQTVDPKTYGQADVQGYENGGWVSKDGIYRMGEGDKNEVVIPVDRPQRAMELINEALNYLGVNNKDTSSPAGASISRGQSFLADNASRDSNAQGVPNPINHSTSQSSQPAIIEFKPEFNITVQSGPGGSIDEMKKMIQEEAAKMFEQFAALYPKGVI